MAFIFGGNAQHRTMADAAAARERHAAAIGPGALMDNAAYMTPAMGVGSLVADMLNRQKEKRAARAQNAFANTALSQMGFGGKYMPGLNPVNLTLDQKMDLFDTGRDLYAADRSHGQAVARTKLAADLAAQAETRRIAAMREDLASQGVELTPEHQLSAYGIDTKPDPMTPAQLAEAQRLAELGFSRDQKTGEIYRTDDRLAAQGGAVAEAIAAERAKAAAAKAQALADEEETKLRELGEQVNTNEVVERVVDELQKDLIWTRQGFWDFIPNPGGGQTKYDNAIQSLKDKFSPVAMRRMKAAGLTGSTSEKELETAVNAIAALKEGDHPREIWKAIQHLQRIGVYRPEATHEWERLMQGDANAAVSNAGTTGNNLDPSLIDLED